ncbi:hypothetical protein SPRG_12606 [Saprolegnia parasitica CBS 223.65]|uniref:F-box domain-containing protein n=1 Tax=Saprolegnia parasitica (strain CBS 223.65) TaxID=695850 RepID=A0A067BU56_SAPPC|nr:hypothetical protein SPRG_12606 [Saprolegnia parasitica CBS 223.65]KDO21788.1 hypothetical protein SPRG_12606 [Saprolegnia parasitica CBS 223.65]|eukprot:XP_012207467.1 hypothetical protein SPRG_12606 [Saprolegnia parasitica CBS 223.65]
MSIPGEVVERVMQYLASADEILMAAELGEASEYTQGLRNLRSAAPRSSLALPVLKANHPLFCERDVAAVVGYPTAIAVTSPGGLRSACLGLGPISADPGMYPCVLTAPLSVYRQAYGGQAKRAIQWTLDSSLQQVPVHSLTLSGGTALPLQTCSDERMASRIRLIVTHGRRVVALSNALQECPTLTTIYIPSSVTFDPAVFSPDVGAQLGDASIASRLECLSLARIAMDLDTWSHVCQGIPSTVRTLTIDDTLFDTVHWLVPLLDTVPRLLDLNHLTLPKHLVECVTRLPLLEEVVISMFRSTNALDLLPLSRKLPVLKKISIAHPDFSYSSLQCLVVELARTAARRVELDIFGGGVDPCKSFEGFARRPLEPARSPWHGIGTRMYKLSIDADL